MTVGETWDLDFNTLRTSNTLRSAFGEMSATGYFDSSFHASSGGFLSGLLTSSRLTQVDLAGQRILSDGERRRNCLRYLGIGRVIDRAMR